jgi:hypothetical protein
MDCFWTNLVNVTITCASDNEPTQEQIDAWIAALEGSGGDGGGGIGGGEGGGGGFGP